MNHPLTSLAAMEHPGVFLAWLGDMSSSESITQISFRGPVYGIFMILLPLLAVAFAFWSYWRNERLTPMLRNVLGTLRSLLYLALLVILFCPFVTLDETVEIPRDVLVLLDQSRSMTLEDPSPDSEASPEATTPAAASRIDIATGLFEQDDRHVLRSLDAPHQVRGFLFGENLHPVGSGADAVANAFSQVVPADEATRGGDALNDILARFGSQQPAAVVMLTDGAFNAGADAMDTAHRMRDLGIPLFTLGIGSEVPNDIRIGQIIAPDLVFPEDTVNVRAGISADGYDGVSVDVRLLLDDVELAATTIELTDGDTFVDLSFVVPEDATGTRNLAVAIDPQPGEQTALNNRSERLIRVVGEKINVLYIEGSPRWEYRYLKVVLERDKRLNVKFLLTQGDPEYAAASPHFLTEYPADPEEAFRYDLVILGDVPSSELETAQMETLERNVRERGASLLMLAGEQYAPASYVDSRIGELLPVRIRRGAPELVPAQRHPTVTAAGRRSFTNLDACDDTADELWKLVSPLHSLPSLDEAKPAANVLLEVADPASGESHPLVAWHYAGTGKVMFIGTDQLWRLRKMRGDAYHAQFWSKAIQFLAVSRLLGENRPIRLETERQEFRVGELVHIHAKVHDDAFVPTTATEYEVRIVPTSADGTPAEAISVQTVTLMPVPDTPGLFHGIARLEEGGRYELTTHPEDLERANVVNLVVAQADSEMRETAMQATYLRALASLTGGSDLTVEDWPTLPDLIPTDPIQALHQRDMDVWDTWPWFVLIVLCAGSEWFIRRRQDLI